MRRDLRKQDTDLSKQQSIILLSSLQSPFMTIFLTVRCAWIVDRLSRVMQQPVWLSPSDSAGCLGKMFNLKISEVTGHQVTQKPSWVGGGGGTFEMIIALEIKTNFNSNPGPLFTSSMTVAKFLSL